MTDVPAWQRSASVDVETHRLDTTNVHGFADTQAVIDHLPDTTNVHGIPDTGDLAKKSEMMVDARWYGVVGDGVADDTVAIQNAIAASKSALMRAGGCVRLPGGEYKITATLDISGSGLVADARVPGSIDGLCILRHAFNGNLLQITGAAGALLRNLYLYQSETTAYTGAAIYGLSTAIDNVGEIYGENLTISGGGGWERDILIDGSANAIGARKIRFINCEFFGATTAGQTIVLKKVAHVSFIGFSLVPAPTAVQQGIRVENSWSSALEFVGYIIGDFYTEAADNLDFSGTITGTITCAAGSQYNRFRGRVGVTGVTNAGTNNKFDKTPNPEAHVTLAANQTIATGGGGAAFIAWATEVLDTDSNAGAGMVDLVADNTSVYVRTDGDYEITVRLAWASNVNGYRLVQLLYNGNVFAADQRVTVNGGETTVAFTVSKRCVAGDRWRVKVTHNAGANVDVLHYGADFYSCNLQVVKVG